MSGAPPAVLEAARAKMKPAAEPVFEVWPENWESFDFFLTLESQWVIVAGMGTAVKTGIDYCRVESTLNILGIPRKNRVKLFRDMRVMEKAALSAWSKKP